MDTHKDGTRDKSSNTTTEIAALSTHVIPESFKVKKRKILESLSMPLTEYADKSPKGSVDVQIADLIDQINGCEGWVTTSSCAGRVSVYAEGFKSRIAANDYDGSLPNDNELSNNSNMGEDFVFDASRNTKSVRSGPGGKGHGGRWLYVSHEPFSKSDLSKNDAHYFTQLFGLHQERKETETSAINLHQTEKSDKIDEELDAQGVRLIRLAFSPLILHIHAATLSHARPLLSSAINAGFRESGLQSLRALEDSEAGTTVAIRTAGLGFETVIGVIKTTEDGAELLESRVSEDYLRMCIGIINERFDWNSVRRERLKDQLVNAAKINGELAESRLERRIRKKKEGLTKQTETQRLDGKQSLDVFSNGQEDVFGGLDLNTE